MKPWYLDSSPLKDRENTQIYQSHVGKLSKIYTYPTKIAVHKKADRDCSFLNLQKSKKLHSIYQAKYLSLTQLKDNNRLMGSLAQIEKGNYVSDVKNFASSHSVKSLRFDWRKKEESRILNENRKLSGRITEIKSVLAKDKLLKSSSSSQVHKKHLVSYKPPLRLAFKLPEILWTRNHKFLEQMKNDTFIADPILRSDILRNDEQKIDKSPKKSSDREYLASVILFIFKFTLYIIKIG